MTKMLILDTEKCVGCRICELICSAKHKRTFKRSLSGIGVIKFDEISKDVPIVCLQCEKPLCLKACKVGALYKDEALGAILFNKEKCIGCKWCVYACPFGNIIFDEEEKEFIKCDLCKGEPSCVNLCPSGALSYKEPEKANMDKRRARAS